MNQTNLFPHPKPRTDWKMTDALGVLEYFFAEADRMGLTGSERDSYARNKTWEKMEGTANDKPS